MPNCISGISMRSGDSLVWCCTQYLSNWVLVPAIVGLFHIDQHSQEILTNLKDSSSYFQPGPCFPSFSHYPDQSDEDFTNTFIKEGQFGLCTALWIQFNILVYNWTQMQGPHLPYQYSESKPCPSLHSASHSAVILSRRPKALCHISIKHNWHYFIRLIL